MTKNKNKLKETIESAWNTTFFLENHLDHFSYPHKVATLEQIAFMVYPDEDKIYYPCSDKVYNAIMTRAKSPFLEKKYTDILEKILKLIEDKVEDDKDKEFIKELLSIKYDHETRDCIIIPSRLEKRLLRIFLNRTQITDPYYDVKKERNQRVNKILESRSFNTALTHIDKKRVDEIPDSLPDIKKYLDYIEFRRLLSISVDSDLYLSKKKYTKKDFLKSFGKNLEGNGASKLLSFLGFKIDKNKDSKKKTILWLANEAGEIMVDAKIINYLASLGHRVVVSFTKGPLFTKADIFDVHEDEFLNGPFKDAYFIKEKSLSKNRLVEILKKAKILLISDGARETTNLLLTSTTFARIFKEVDGVISRGIEQKRVFFGSSFQFTQDIFNILEGENSVVVSYKAKHPSVIKFSHNDLEILAKEIIDGMKEAKKKKMTVMFYSGIIGSIPGKIDVAKKIMSVFIKHLEGKFAGTHIINPSDYYKKGMDADDLMYMWEIVQTSGCIDTWRFQTYNDIADTFSLMKKRVPPEWVGKDATYSTGCTKEMRIALRVQKEHPEMQIIGPSKEMFIRRSEYGVGKMYDKVIEDI
ncbi:MAG: protein-glutamate O-methyltransferase family protein [Deltaproteobacteria bacterium]|nr:protein-glutamate O-methyltransferase family protein [Deltaproteobacteria bacterium]